MAPREFGDFALFSGRLKLISILTYLGRIINIVYAF